MSDISHVTVLGTGVLGSQIAYQIAFSGVVVSVYDISDTVLAHARERFAGLAATYVAEVASATTENTEAALTRISYFSDLAPAVVDADLVIEAVPEVLTIKQDTYSHLAALAPARTIFATNSSTMLPSAMKGFTGRPDRFLALHFANRVWVHNTAEVMGTTDTDPEVFRRIVAFAGKIGMVAIPLHKEKAGYLLNSMLVPLLNSAMGLAAGGFADPADVDQVWKIATGAPLGPFQILDVVGLTTPYNIMSQGGEADLALAQWLKVNYIDQGKLGVESGEGFYSYAKA
jgi:3-hydroxyacyl-CoA dehydrogenase